MPRIRLKDVRSGQTHDFETAEVRIGRDPGFELVIQGAGREVVSASHAKLVYREGSWWVEDAGSRNGTYLGERRLEPGRAAAVAEGSVISLGKGGVRLLVDAVGERRISDTLVESPRDVARARAAVQPEEATAVLARPEGADDAAVAVVLVASSGQRFEARGATIRIGRGRECEVKPVGTEETAISRIHTVITVGEDGGAVVRDAQSRNGTYVNGVALAAEHPLRDGDVIRLGSSGPELRVERVTAPGGGVRRAPRATFGGRGRTTFFTEKLAEATHTTARRVRLLVWAFVGLLAVAVAGLLWHGERRVRAAARLLAAQQEQVVAAQRAAADSMRQAAAAEYARLERQLADAQASAAPVAVVESLRTALSEAGARTTALEEALQRAQAALSHQVAAGDSLQRRAEGELARLRGELRRARESQVSSATVDSLRTAVRSAEERASVLAAQVRAVRGVNLAAVAQVNQAAVGLVTAYFGDEVFDGSGFVITPTGYFVTNRHVITENQRPADSLFVTMADQRFMLRSDAVSMAPASGPDLAVLRIRDYSGPHVPGVDWSGNHVRQGEPAALIGFPAGLTAALDQSQTVRTSMSAGVFSKVTADLIQFDGFTVSGSSGSPIFNADGEVVAVHRAGLREAAGLGFAVPVTLLVPLLPQSARTELGLP
jgi:pSer/pThr/pTyr-binding forkhead associated (FHA) protein/S1-C subfamily serine protease